MNFTRLWIVPLLTLLLNVAGCPITEDDPPNLGQLTAQQQAAVAQVARQTSGLAAVYGTCAALTDTRANFELDGTVEPFGACPVITLNASGGTSTALLDFGTAGCSSSATAGGTVSGSLQLTLARATQSATAVFQSLSVNGHTITGDLTAAFQRTADGIALDGNGTLTTSASDTAVGTATVAINSAARITIATGDLTMTSGTTGYVVALSNIVLDPIGNGNFLPQSGTATFGIPNVGRTPREIAVIVTFDALTPVDRTVSVKIGNTGAIEYELPV